MSIEIKGLYHIYAKGTPFEREALTDINLSIPDGQYIALIGHTGSGKTTLIQHLNGIIKTQTGCLSVQDCELSGGKADLRQLRRKVGLVFQYPEYQLFEETVEKDIAFGPKNLGLSEQEIQDRVTEAIDMVGLDMSCRTKSPFELSGGQKRRVAIAGVLSMRPQVLILDEPIAGLDPMGRQEILKLISGYHTKTNATIIIVSHNMDDVADIAQRVIVMHHGRVAMDGTPHEVFSNTTRLKELGMNPPQAAELAAELRARGMKLPQDIITSDELFNALTGRGRD